MRKTRLTKAAGKPVAMVGLAAVLTVAALVIGSASAGANEYGNQDYLGILRAQPPTGFPVSPAALDLSKGPVSVNFAVPATDLKSTDQTVTIGFSVHRIMTFQGQDVSDGQPGQPGITFPPGAPKQTTQTLYGARQTGTFTVPAGQSTPTMITFTATISDCGYFQIDFATPTTPYTYLASGFTRALGCTNTTKPPTPGTPGPTPATPPSAVLGTTVTAPATPAVAPSAQVLGLQLSAPSQLPVTGGSTTLFVLAMGLLLAGATLVAASRLVPRRSGKGAPS